MDRLVSNLNTIISENKASAAQQAAIMSGQDKLDRLRHSMIDAKNKVHNGPGELKNAEKAYYTALKGETGYRLWKEENAAKDISGVMNTYTTNFDDKITRLYDLANVLDSQQIYTSRMGDIQQNYVEKRKGLEIKVANTIQKKNVDDRLATFYTGDITATDSYISFVKKIYWFLIVLFVVAIIFKQGYKNTATLLQLAIFIIMPFIGKKVISLFKIQSAFNYIIELFGKVLMFISFSFRMFLDKIF